MANSFYTADLAYLYASKLLSAMVIIGSGSSEISIQAVKSFIDTRKCYFY